MSTESIERWRGRYLESRANNAFDRAMRRRDGQWTSEASTKWSWHRAPTFSTGARSAKSGGARVRRALVLASLACAVGFTAAVTLISTGFILHSPQTYEARLSRLKLSPVVSSDSELIGAIGRRDVPVEELVEFGYLPLHEATALPQVYRAALLDMEYRYYDQPGMRNVCGLDAIGTPWRMLASGFRAGGSTLAQQLARNLTPEWLDEENFFERGARKFFELGAACGLHIFLTEKAGTDGVVRAYAAYAPVAQSGAGSLHGIVAGAQVLFGKTPQKLDAAEQLALAATHYRPLRTLSPGEANVPCSLVRSGRDNPDFDVQASKKFRGRVNQCRILERAESRLNLVPLDQRDAARNKIHAWRQNGIEPANPWPSVAARRLINLSSRSVAVLGPSLISRIASESEFSNAIVGEPINVTLDAGDARGFREGVLTALHTIQTSAGWRFCMPLFQGSSAQARCGIHDEKVHALTLAARMRINDGGLEGIYMSTPQMLDKRISVGSLSKWILAVAAVHEGYTAKDKVCPRSARDGARRLRRVTQPVFGVAACLGDAHMIALADVLATSDNLAAFELARTLPARALREATAALGLSADDLSDAELQYAVSFGTFVASPAQMLAAVQRAVALAYELPLQAHGPRLVESARPEAHRSLVWEGKRSELRLLLEAPVQRPSGTLRNRKDFAVGGKTGTISGVTVGAGRPPVHAKFVVEYHPQNNYIGLLLLTSPRPDQPLAPHDLQTRELTALFSSLTP